MRTNGTKKSTLPGKMVSGAEWALLEWSTEGKVGIIQDTGATEILLDRKKSRDRPLYEA